jgi:hypothetical protein
MPPNNNPEKKRTTRKIILDRQDVERAMKYTKSNKAAARYLGLSFKTYKNIASQFKNEEGKSLYELHLNPSGLGIPKYANTKSRGPVLLDILEGRVDTNMISMKEIKGRIISEGYMKEECSRCKFREKRVLDEKVPLIVNYLDNNKKNWKLENLEFLCYNCYFLHVGDVFQKKQVEAMEDYKVFTTPIDLELPKIYDKEIKSSVNLENKHIYKSEEKPEDFGNDLIVSIKKR